MIRPPSGPLVELGDGDRGGVGEHPGSGRVVGRDWARGASASGPGPRGRPRTPASRPRRSGQRRGRAGRCRDVGDVLLDDVLVLDQVARSAYACRRATTASRRTCEPGRGGTSRRPARAWFEMSTAWRTKVLDRCSGRRARSAISRLVSRTMPLPIFPAAPRTATCSSRFCVVHGRLPLGARIRAPGRAVSPGRDEKECPAHCRGSGGDSATNAARPGPAPSPGRSGGSCNPCGGRAVKHRVAPGPDSGYR